MQICNLKLCGYVDGKYDPLVPILAHREIFCLNGLVALSHPMILGELYHRLIVLVNDSSVLRISKSF